MHETPRITARKVSTHEQELMVMIKLIEIHGDAPRCKREPIVSQPRAPTKRAAHDNHYMGMAKSLCKEPFPQPKIIEKGRKFSGTIATDLKSAFNLKADVPSISFTR